MVNSFVEQNNKKDRDKKLNNKNPTGSKPLSKKELAEAQKISDDLFQESMMQYYADVEQKVYEQKHVDMRQVKTLLSEYMDSFILIGFDMNGTPVSVQSEADVKSSFALSDHLQREFIKHMMKRGQHIQMGGMPPMDPDDFLE